MHLISSVKLHLEVKMEHLKKVKNALNQFSEITLRGLMNFPSTTLRNTEQAFPSISKITLDL